MANEVVKNALKNAGMKQWELAELLEISEYTLCRKLRRELSDSDKEHVLTVIKQNGKGGE